MPVVSCPRKPFLLPARDGEADVGCSSGHGAVGPETSHRTTETLGVPTYQMRGRARRLSNVTSAIFYKLYLRESPCWPVIQIRPESKGCCPKSHLPHFHLVQGHRPQPPPRTTEVCMLVHGGALDAREGRITETTRGTTPERQQTHCAEESSPVGDKRTNRAMIICGALESRLLGFS